MKTILGIIVGVLLLASSVAGQSLGGGGGLTLGSFNQVGRSEFETVRNLINAHTNDFANPHETTLSQVGAASDMASVPFVNSLFDDLNYRLGMETFSQWGYREAVSYSTPMGAVESFVGVGDIGVGSAGYQAFTKYVVIGGFPTNVLAWGSVAGLPAARYYGSAAALNDSVYFMAGSDGSTTKTNVWRYIPASNRWYTVAGLPAARHYGSAAALNDSVYFMAGTDGTIRTNVWRYIPASNRWYTVAGLPAARYAGSEAALNGSAYFMGGYDGTSKANVYATVRTGSGGSLYSVPTPLSFTAERAQMLAYLGSAMTYTRLGTNSTPARYGTDWTMRVSANNGTNWTTISTLTPGTIYASTNFYGGVVTNVTPGVNLRCAITASSNTIINLRGWQRFGGQN